MTIFDIMNDEQEQTRQRIDNITERLTALAEHPHFDLHTLTRIESEIKRQEQEQSGDFE